MRLARVLPIAVMAIACVTATPPVWSQVEDQYLCSTVGNWRGNPQVHAQGVQELIRRGKVRKQNAETILKRQIQIGMSECEVIASWGWPRDQNRSHYAFGTHNQMIWRAYDTAPATYVYTEDHVVTSWQESD